MAASSSSVATLLKWAARDNDRTMLFGAEVNGGRSRRMIAFSEHQQAVRPAGPLRRRLVPAQSRREGRPRRPQRLRQDHAVPHDRRRGSARRRRRLGAEEADDRLLPPGRRGDVGPLGARRSDRRQRPRRRSAPRARGAAARDGRSGAGRRHGRDPRALRRGAGGVRAPRRLRARERRRAKSCTASASTTSGSTATSARCRAAGRCAWRWRACCSASPTSC